MIITDEMMHKARKVYWHHGGGDEKGLYAALEAVAPMLIAQGMEDALAIARRTLVWSADQEAKFVDALRDAGMA